MQYLIGVCGDDTSSTDLQKILSDEGVDISHVVIDRERPTTKKTRISAIGSKLSALIGNPPTRSVKKLSKHYSSKLKRLQGVEFLLISDYGKGLLNAKFLQAAIAICQQRGMKVIADPKGVDYEKYSGAFLITPNRKEASEALGVDPFQNHDRAWLASNWGNATSCQMCW